MTTPSPAFSLLHEPWVPVELDDGTNTELSLEQVFSRPSRIRRVVGESSPQRYALLRLLLAVFWRAHFNDASLRGSTSPDRFGNWWADRFEAIPEHEADRESLAYLERHADRFELFGPTPFMQVAGLATPSGHYSEVRRLVPEAESDFFALRAGDGLAALSFAEAARWLITVQSYDYSGIKSGAVGDPRVKAGKGYPIGTGWTGMTGGVIIVGANLAETLLLNTVAPQVFAATAADDRPPWEREPDTAAQRPSTQPTGACDLVTWQSRRILLHTDGDAVTGALVSNGDQIPDAGANIQADPMTPYRYSRNKSKKGRTVYYPRPHDGERTVWRALEPLLMRDGIVNHHLRKGDEPPKAPATINHLHALRSEGLLQESALVSVELISVVYGSQSASVREAVHARLDFPIQVLDGDDPRIVHTIFTAARQAQECATAFGQFAGQLLQAAGGEYEFRADRANELLNSLEPEFQSWLSRVAPDRLDAHLHDWFETIERILRAQAVVLVQSAGPAAMIGRTVVFGEREHMVTAGTAYQVLQRKIRDLLPRRTDELETANAH